MFSGYGIPLNEGKSPLVGMLMVDRPRRCPNSYIRELRDAFGEAIVGHLWRKQEISGSGNGNTVFSFPPLDQIFFHQYLITVAWHHRFLRKK
jgi:hypothetical protein